MANSTQAARASELFRFVKVRNPEPASRAIPKPAARLLAKTGIPIDPSLGKGTELYAPLQKLAESKQPKVEAYFEIANAFRNGKSYLPGVEATRRVLPSALLNELEATAPESLDHAIELASSITGYAVKSLGSDPKFQADYATAWDNLLLQCISVQPDMGQVHALSEVIRGMELMLRLVAAREVKEYKPEYIRAVRKSYVVLPQELHPGRLASVAESPKAVKANEGLEKFQKRKALFADAQLLTESRELLAYWVGIELDQPAPVKAITKVKLTAAEMEAQAKALETPVAPSIEKLTLSSASLEGLASLATNGKEIAARLGSLVPAGKSVRYATLQARIDQEINRVINEATALMPSGGQKVTTMGKTLLIQELPNYEVLSSQEPLQAKPADTPASKDPCRIKTIGTGDLYRVEHKQICYRAGEIAHIENIMSGEERERRTRRLKRSEENFSEEVEKIMEEERDSQTTERNEMEIEANKTVSQDFGLQSGVTISGSYGMVSFEANLGFSMSQSTTESHSSAQRFSKEVVEKTRRKVSERLKSSKSLTLIEEFEENNGHKLSNTSDQNRVGIYRWVDKYMKARVVNYGKRAFIQFAVPEPAAYHLYNKSETPQANFPVVKPVSPSDTAFQSYYGMAPVRSHRDVTPANYAQLAAIYGAVDLKPLGRNTQYLTEVMPIPDKGSTDFKANYFIASRAIQLPTGFAATKVFLNVSHGNAPQKLPVLHYYHKNNGATQNDDLLIDYQDGKLCVVTVEDHTQYNPGTSSTTFANATATYSGSLVMDGGITGNLNIAAKSILPILATITVKLQRTEENYQQWQIETYNTIMAAYRAKQSAYDQALNELKYEVRYVGGNNPGINREIEARELKRGCLEELMNVRKTMAIPCTLRWGWFGAIVPEDFNCNGKAMSYPAIDNCKAIAQGKEVMFFEQAFEWDHMSYIFYPYYWGSRCKWQNLYSLEDNDPMFLNFLQSGMARSVVPIRPGFEQAVMNYLETGLVWDSQDQPVIGDPMFVDILEEIKEAYDYNEGLIPDSDPRVVSVWEYKLPTNLIILQKDAQPHDEIGLPCQQKPTIE